MASRSALRFGRRAVDLIGEDDVAKQRPFDEPEDSLAGGVILFEDFGGDVAGHGSGVNWMRRKRRSSSDASVETSSGQAGHPLQHAVATAQKANEQLLRDLLHADNHTAELLAEHLALLVQAVNGIGHIGFGKRPGGVAIVAAGGRHAIHPFFERLSRFIGRFSVGWPLARRSSRRHRRRARRTLLGSEKFARGVTSKSLLRSIRVNHSGGVRAGAAARRRGAAVHGTNRLELPVNDGTVAERQPDRGKQLCLVDRVATAVERFEHLSDLSQLANGEPAIFIGIDRRQ